MDAGNPPMCRPYSSSPPARRSFTLRPLPENGLINKLRDRMQFITLLDGAIAPVILVTLLLVVWPGWLRTAQAQSWANEESGRVRHIVVTLNKSRTLRFDNLDRHSQPAGEDSLHERRKQELFKVRGRSPSPILFGFALHGRRCRTPSQCESLPILAGHRSEQRVLPSPGPVGKRRIGALQGRG